MGATFCCKDKNNVSDISDDSSNKSKTKSNNRVINNSLIKKNNNKKLNDEDIISPIPLLKEINLASSKSRNKKIKHNKENLFTNSIEYTDNLCTNNSKSDNPPKFSKYEKIRKSSFLSLSNTSALSIKNEKYFFNLDDNLANVASLENFDLNVIENEVFEIYFHSLKLEKISDLDFYGLRFDPIIEVKVGNEKTNIFDKFIVRNNVDRDDDNLNAENVVSNINSNSNKSTLPNIKNCNNCMNEVIFFKHSIKLILNKHLLKSFIIVSILNENSDNIENSNTNKENVIIGQAVINFSSISSKEYKGRIELFNWEMKKIAEMNIGICYGLDEENKLFIDYLKNQDIKNNSDKNSNSINKDIFNINNDFLDQSPISYRDISDELKIKYFCNKDNELYKSKRIMIIF